MKLEKHKKIVKPLKPKNSNHVLGTFSANDDGLGKKIHSLKFEINETQSQIFTLQET